LHSRRAAPANSQTALTYYFYFYFYFYFYYNYYDHYHYYYYYAVQTCGAPHGGRPRHTARSRFKSDPWKICFIVQMVARVLYPYPQPPHPYYFYYFYYYYLTTTSTTTTTVLLLLLRLALVGGTAAGASSARPLASFANAGGPPRPHSLMDYVGRSF
jgi:hypothetical protein